MINGTQFDEWNHSFYKIDYYIYTYIVSYFMHGIQHFFTSYIYKGLMLFGLSANVYFLQMNMTRKFHNHRLQTDPQLHEIGQQKKQSNQLSFSAR